MWVYDTATLGILAVNEAAIRHYGYSRHEFLAMTIKDLRPPEDVSDLVEQVARLAGGHDTRLGAVVDSGAWRHRRKDGSVIDVEVTSEGAVFEGRGARVVVAIDVTERNRALAALAEREHQLRDAQALARLGSWEWDASGIRWSDELLRIAGLKREDFGGTTEEALSYFHPDDQAEVKAACQRAVRNREAFRSDLRMVRTDGEVRWVDVRGEATFDEDGNPQRMHGTVLDVTAQRQTEAALAERARLALFSAEVSTALAGDESLSEMLRRCCQAMVDRLDGAFARIWTISADGATLELQASAGMYTHTDGGHARVPVGELKIGLIAAERRPHLTNSVVGDQRVSDQEWARREGMVAFAGYPLLLGGRLVGVMAMFARHDLSDAVLSAMGSVANAIAVGIERKRGEAALSYQSLHDPLTRLPNRSLLLDRLGQALARCRRRETQAAVLLLDLDHFKVVNDSLGHAAGDELLVAVAQRLQEAVRPSDTVARFGGDEFVVVCEDLVSEWEAVVVGQRLSAALAAPFLLDGAEHFVTVSLGVVLADPDDTPEQLVRDADSAMYEAKQRGRARAEVFDKRLHIRASARLKTESALRRALEQGEFILEYQPIVSLVEGRIVGAEALVRWQDPERGTIYPADFIPVAEETGLILPIGAWVLQEACRQSRHWRERLAHQPPLNVSVNLSARQLLDPDFLDLVAGALAENDLDPAGLHLEITETVLMEDADFHIQALTALKALGVRLAMDDFGTGYSSLSYLRRFPVDKIKVDRSFISGLQPDSSEWSIVAAIIAMADALGRLVLAEGVETEEQLIGLRSLGCGYAQGFHFAHPLPSDALIELVAAEPTW